LITLNHTQGTKDKTNQDWPVLRNEFLKVGIMTNPIQPRVCKFVCITMDRRRCSNPGEG